MIYFIQAGSGDQIKIGYAGDFNKRLATLQCGNPEKLYRLALIEGTEKQECRLHDLLIGVPRRGEWFKLDGVVKVALALAQERYPIDCIYAILEAYNLTNSARKQANRARVSVAHQRRLLGDIGVGRASKRCIATRLPELRKAASVLHWRHARAKSDLLATIRAAARSF